MDRRFGLAGAATVIAFAAVLSARVLSAGTRQTPEGNPDSWQIPPNAAAEKNPVEASPAVLKKGLQLYNAKCERCHGSEGKGDGPDADPDAPPEDLTNPARASRNPDGVMFYKIWNGRKNPKMPAFKTDLSKNDVWTVINFVKTLRS
jgi:mono/diheme cytochrome c family protein